MFSSPKPDLTRGAATFISCGSGGRGDCRASARGPMEGWQAVQIMILLLAIGPFLALGPDRASAQPISGVVTSSKGPEAGVWVIAETEDLPTKFARIVVTDDQGRFLVPDLPSANYQVFVRGYGLLDSPRQAAKPGQQLNVKVGIAPDARSAAQVYPAAWWLSMLTTTRSSSTSSRWT